MVTHVAWIHGMSPVNVGDVNSQRLGHGFTLLGARQPSTGDDRLDSFDMETGPPCDFINRQVLLFKQRVDGLCSHGVYLRAGN